MRTDKHSGSITDLQITVDKTMVITSSKDTTAKASIRARGISILGSSVISVLYCQNHGGSCQTETLVILCALL